MINNKRLFINVSAQPGSTNVGAPSLSHCRKVAGLLPLGIHNHENQCQRYIHICRIRTFFRRQPTHSPTHCYKGIEIFLKTFICFLMQSGHCSKLGPIKLPPPRIKHHTKCGDHTIKVSFLSSSPPISNKNIQKLITGDKPQATGINQMSFH